MFAIEEFTDASADGRLARPCHIPGEAQARGDQVIPVALE
jgi:hypothetical protein